MEYGRADTTVSDQPVTNYYAILVVEERLPMESKHWFAILVLLVAAYLIGCKYPAWGNKAVSTVQSAV